MNNNVIENGIVICNPPLAVDSAISFAFEHLDCDFIMKPLSTHNSSALIIAYAASPEASINVDTIYKKYYKEKGYFKVRGLSSNMVNTI